MNLYAIFPLIGFFANIILGCFILYKKPEDKAGRIFTLYSLALAIWALGDLFPFILKMPEVIVRLDIITIVGSSLTAVFLLHFFLIFTEENFISSKFYRVIIYLPSLFFIFISLKTNFITISAEPVYWGYYLTRGALYFPFVFYIFAYAFGGLLICSFFYFKKATERKKIQARLILSAISFLFIIGTITQIIPILFNSRILPPLTSSMSAIAAVVIVYSITKYGLSSITPAMAADRIIETMNDYLVVFDKDKNVSLINNSTLKMLGNKREEIEGKPLNILKTEAENLFKILESNSLVENYETKILNKEKKTIYISINASVIKSEAGDIQGYIFVMVNISRTKELIKRLENSGKDLDKQLKETKEQNTRLEETQGAMINLIEDSRLLEENLKKERDRISAIITSMGEGLVVVDKTGAITYINLAAEKMLKVSQDNIKGQHIDKAIPLYARPDGKAIISLLDRPIAKAIKTGKTVISTVTDNFYFENSLGRRFAVSIVAAPLLLGGEEIFGAVTIFRDITAEKQLDEAKTSFISVSSHQLRTPLTSMRWFSEMLIAGDAGPITEEQRHFVERIYQGTDRMIALVNLLLQIARVEAGRVKIEPTPVDFKTITQGVLVTLKTYLDEKSQKVVVKSEPTKLPLIPMDQEVVWQVIQNLLTNANRYSPEKSKILISIVKEGEMLEYSVKNEGIGIPEDQQSRIFQKFFRADNALKAVPTGSGLGLSLVKLLVEGWGGKIWFESAENKGATFYFTVPLTGMQAKEGEVKLNV
jgi:PAS domain S-box-containing protein